MSTEEVQAYFNDIAQSWDSMNHCNEEKLRRIVELSGIERGCKVLDLACGTGVLTGYLLETTPFVTGLDLAENMVARAREKYAGTTARFLRCDFYDFAGESFDAVILHNAYPHFENKERLVTCLAAVLKPGGRLVVAHSIGREHLNRVHRGRPRGLSAPLGPADQEALLFAGAFEIDQIIDEKDFYAFSGIKI